MIDLTYKTGSKFVHIPGKGRNDLARMFCELGFTNGVEIGTEGGKYAQVLLQSNPNLHLTCIDPWMVYADGGGYKDVDQNEYDGYFKMAQKRTKGYNVTFLRTFSSEAIKNFPDESVDFVYIDGNHRLDYVVFDIINWAEKVKPGGIVAGHDFLKLRHQHNSHVAYAVEAYMRAFGVYPIYILDNKDKSRGQEESKNYDRIKSWFFVREPDRIGEPLP